MRFKVWLEMEVIDADFSFGKTWKMNVLEDEFIHFTTRDRANQILESGKLLMRPPYEKFGTDTVDAVSLTFGSHLPSVQTTHIKDNDLVAIKFKTNTVPHYGMSDEVKWIGDVNLINPQILEFNEAVRLLQSVKPPKGFDEDDDKVIYVDPDTYRRTHKVYTQFKDDSTQKSHDMLQKN